jgi:hypothetical protein
MSTYPRIILGIWNNIRFTRLGFSPTPNIEQWWSTGRLLLLPLFSLRQPDIRARNCQYMLYRRHSFVDHDTFKIRRHNSTHYATVHRKCLYIQWHWIRMLLMVKPGKEAEGGEEETDEYNNGPHKWPHRRQYTDPNTFHIMSNRLSFLQFFTLRPLVQTNSDIIDTSFLVIWNYDESNRSWNVGECVTGNKLATSNSLTYTV